LNSFLIIFNLEKDLSPEQLATIQLRLKGPRRLDELRTTDIGAAGGGKRGHDPHIFRKYSHFVL